MEKKTKILKTISFPERAVEMVNEVMERNGMPTFTSALCSMIAAAYPKMIRDYVDKMGIRQMTPEEKAANKEREKQATGRIQYDRQKLICDALEGTVEKSGHGYVCKYFTHSKYAKYPQTVPLDILTEDLLKSQYSPSKELVLEYRAKVASGEIKPVESQIT